MQYKIRIQSVLGFYHYCYYYIDYTNISTTTTTINMHIGCQKLFKSEKI